MAMAGICERSAHQKRVDKFMGKAGQEAPSSPSVPSEEIRLLRAKLILEECLETIEALGFHVHFNSSTYQVNCHKHAGISFVPHSNGPDLIEVVDGCCDIIVVTTGTLTALGVADVEVQEAIDESNLAKFGPGGHRREDGKWMKGSDWKKPDIAGILKRQGCSGQ